MPGFGNRDKEKLQVWLEINIIIMTTSIAESISL